MAKAVDHQSVNVSNFITKRSPSWAPHVVSSTNQKMLTQSLCLKHPDTKSNPIRSDGTRARSSWNKSWFRMVIPVSTFETRAKPGKDAWFHPSQSVPCVGNWFQGTTGDASQWQNLEFFRPSAAELFYQDQVARTKILNKVAQKKWDLGVSTLEMKQTAGLVSALAKDMVFGIQKIVNSKASVARQTNNLLRETRKHGDFYKAAEAVGMRDTRLLESIKDRWMQYQFGIRPALNDVDSATRALDDLIFKENHGLRISAKGGHSSSEDHVLSMTPTNMPFSTVISYNRRLETHYSASYDVPLDGVSSLTTLGLDNPASIGWEVTRLSWMFDYVVGVGDWLQSFSAANGLLFVDGSVSTIWRATSGRVQAVLNPQLDIEWVRRPKVDRFHLAAGEFRRELVSSRILPGVVPQVKTTLGLTQLANSLFALSNVFAGGKAPR